MVVEKSEKRIVCRFLTYEERGASNDRKRVCDLLGLVESEPTCDTGRGMREL